MNDKKSSEGNYLYTLHDVDSFTWNNADKIDDNILSDNIMEFKSNNENENNDVIPEDEERFEFDTENDEDDLLIPY